MARTEHLCKASRDAWWSYGTYDPIVKPWGYEQPLTHQDAKPAYKLLHIKRYQETSMHFHKKKDEVFFVLDGEIVVVLGKRVINGAVFDERKVPLGRYDELHIPPNIPHRVRAVGDATILEVSSVLKGDVYRVENHWGRGDEP